MAAGAAQFAAPAPPLQPTPPLVIVSLVAGVAGWVLTPVLPLVGGLVAVVTGHLARSQIRRENADGKGVALAGLVLGYSALAVPCLAIAAVGVITFFGDNIRSMFGMAADAIAEDPAHQSSKPAHRNPPP